MGDEWQNAAGGNDEVEVYPMQTTWSNPWMNGPLAQSLYDPCPNKVKTKDMKEVEGGGPWYDVIDVRRILCFGPLVPNYEQTEHATIPASAHSFQQRCFQHGRADMPTKPGSGAKTYFVNTAATRFGKQQHVARATQRAGTSGLSLGAYLWTLFCSNKNKIKAKNYLKTYRTAKLTFTEQQITAQMEIV